MLTNHYSRDCVGCGSAGTIVATNGIYWNDSYINSLLFINISLSSKIILKHIENTIETYIDK